MNLPHNRFILLSALWFAGSIYSLLFKAAETARRLFRILTKWRTSPCFSHKSGF